MHPFKYYWTDPNSGSRRPAGNYELSKARRQMTFPQKFAFPILSRFYFQMRDWKHKFDAHGKSILNVSLYNTLEPAQKKNSKDMKTENNLKYVGNIHYGVAPKS